METSHHQESEAGKAMKVSAVPPTVDEQAARWLVRNRDGLSDAESALFAKWLQADAAHAQAYNTLEGTWQRLDSLPAAEVRRLIDRKTASVGPTRLRGLLAVAASVGMAISLGLIIHLQPAPDFSAHYATAPGESRDIALPDGTSVILDSQTEGQTRYYAERRQFDVQEGQALFEVSPDKKRPFQIMAGQVRITVLGTKFSVRHTSTGLYAGGVNVAVQRGLVKVEQVGPAILGMHLPALFGSGNAVELRAGEQVTMDAEGRLGVATPIDPESVATWRTGRLSFDDTPLAIALQEFARYHKAVPAVADAKTGALRVTGSFQNNRLDSFVRILPDVLPVHIAPGSQVISLRSNN